MNFEGKNLKNKAEYNIIIHYIYRENYFKLTVL